MKSDVLDEIAHILQEEAITPPLFELQNVSVDYKLSTTAFRALHNVSLQGYPRETLGIVGESGCGKSTLAKTLLCLQPPTQGKVLFRGQDLHQLKANSLRQKRKEMQMIFQDPDASLNPRMTVYEHIVEPLMIHGLFDKPQVLKLLDMVQLPAQVQDKYPYQLSGGQKQRVSIARALSVMPKLIVCDEPLSALDVSVSTQIIQLLQELQAENNLAYLFITHDLASLRLLAHRIAVFYLGNLVEEAPTEMLYRTPLHPYTQGLMSAVAIPDPEKERRRSRVVITGEIPSVLAPPTGCPFHTRCPMAREECRRIKPQLLEIKPKHYVACHLYKN
ncbi:MAG: ABC transporter ATP-binding protein [Verrucomicrobia bacterium]|nr:ABC transporter ATP-binding protein [Verrucomicrobiota bacterium]